MSARTIFVPTEQSSLSDLIEAWYGDQDIRLPNYLREEESVQDMPVHVHDFHALSFRLVMELLRAVVLDESLFHEWTEENDEKNKAIWKMHIESRWNVIVEIPDDICVMMMKETCYEFSTKLIRHFLYHGIKTSFDAMPLDKSIFVHNLEDDEWEAIYERARNEGKIAPVAEEENDFLKMLASGEVVVLSLDVKNPDQSVQSVEDLLRKMFGS